MKRPDITPGPWRVVERRNNLHIYGSAAGGAIATIHDPPTETSQLAAYGAQAIASLPDLLKTLEIVLHSNIDDDAMGWSNLDNGKRVYLKDAVRETLTKAGYTF